MAAWENERQKSAEWQAAWERPAAESGDASASVHEGSQASHSLWPSTGMPL